jgi:prepilin-type processing-associated H-X9-DG protein
MRRRTAFTLVELLVVVGIVALLIAILMPSLARAREHARRVQCASNLRQVTLATIMYADRNGGVMPGVGRFPHQPHDWIYWGRVAPYDALDDSAIAPYLGRPLTAGVLRCPSDDWESRESGFKNMSGRPPYPYLFSYTLNRYMGNWTAEKTRLTQVRASSEKILFVEEDVRTMVDGVWLEPYDVTVISVGEGRSLVPTRWEPISARHDRVAPAEDPIPPESMMPTANVSVSTFMSRRGNVSFADGHVDYVTREFTHQRRHVFPASDTDAAAW